MMWMKKVCVVLLTMFSVLVASAQAPNWTVTPSDYQFSSTLTGTVIINDTIVNSSGNVLGAFVNDEVRGIASPVLVGNTVMYFMTMYSNQATGDQVDFKFYWESQDSTYNVLENLVFASNSTHGSPDEPFELHLNEGISAFFVDLPWANTNVNQTQFDPLDLSQYTSKSGGVAIEYAVVSASPNLTANVVNNTLYVSHNGSIGIDSVLVRIVDSVNSTVVYDQQYVYHSVVPVNSPITFTEVGEVKLGNNSEFCIDLNAYLTNDDDDEIQWQVFGTGDDSSGDTTLNWSVTPSDYQYSMNFAISGLINGVVIEKGSYQLGAFDETNNVIGIGSPVLVGDEYVIFLTAYSNSSSGKLHFELWDSESLVLFVDQIDDQDFVVDGVVGSIADPFELPFGAYDFSFSNEKLCLSLFDSTEGIVDTFTVIATEVGTDEQYTDTVVFTIAYFDDNQPFLSGVPNQSVLAGDLFSSFDLTSFLTEIDGDSVVYSVEGHDSLNVSIQPNGMVEITAVSQTWTGEVYLIFKVTDFTSAGLFDIDTVWMSRLPGIVLDGIPDQSITEQQSFTSVNLDNYLTHFYNDPVTYSVQSNELQAVISGGNLQVFVPNSSWLGIDTLIVRVQNTVQTQLIDFDTVIYEVRVIADPNLPIELTGVSDIYLGPDSSLCFHYQNNLINVDDDDVTWGLVNSDTSHFVAVVDQIGMVCLELRDSVNFTDSLMLWVQESSTIEQFSDSVWIRVHYSSDRAPIWDVIPNQSIPEGGSFSAVLLSSFVTELDGDSVVYSYSGANNVTVTIDSANVAVVEINDSSWVGSDTIRFVVTDITSNGYSDWVEVVFTVGANLYLDTIPDQTVNEGQSFVVVNLLDYLNYLYPDSVVWSVSSQELITVVANNQLNVYFPSSNWVGTDTLIVEVQTIGEPLLTDSDTVVFSVVEVIGLQGNVKNVFAFYPNPTTGRVYFEREMNFEVYNLRGLQLMSGLGKSIDLSTYKEGIYIVKVDGGAFRVVRQ